MIKHFSIGDCKDNCSEVCDSQDSEYEDGCLLGNCTV